MPNTFPRRAGSARALFVAAALGLVAAAPVSAQAPTLPTVPATISTTDPRASLRAGWKDAGVAAMNVELVATLPKTGIFVNAAEPGDFSKMNSDIAFSGNTLYVGNFAGVQIYDISDPTKPRLRGSIECPGGQNDVSVYGNLLFVSVEETRGRIDCSGQGIEGRVSAERFRGVRIFDVSNLDTPRPIARVQTCRGSHTHTLVPDPRDPDNLYVYVSGTAGVRPGEELAGCSDDRANADGSSYFRIEVIKVPLATPAQAAIVTSARFLLGLPAPPTHAATAAEVAAARARGAFIITYQGEEMALPEQYAAQMLTAVVARRGGSGAATAADSAAVRQMLPAMIAQQGGGDGSAARTGPTACHDITVYPEVGLAGGACEGYGVLLDIRDPANPQRINEYGDPNFAYWHSATFNNDGTAVVFTDEWGGGTAPRCRATDRPEWGANALFAIDGTGANRTLRPASYYKMPAAQGNNENCVAHNGSLVPVPGRDVMVQAWYQGGLSIFDFTDPARPVEIAYYDRGPMHADRLDAGGYWSVYWYNGYLYGSEIGRGIDVLRLVPGAQLSANEIAAAGTVRVREVNPQLQTRNRFDPSVTLARAYLDQAVRARTLTAARAARVTADLDRAARATTAQRRSAATRLAATARTLTGTDAGVRRLATALTELSTSMR